MRFSAYVTLEGPAFDLSGFNQNLSPELRGEVKDRSCMKLRSGGPERFYWKSRVVEASENIEESLAALLFGLKDSLRDVVGSFSVKVSAQIVTWQGEGESARGFYISSGLIKLLAEFDADLDIDVVHDLVAQ